MRIARPFKLVLAPFAVLLLAAVLALPVAAQGVEQITIDNTGPRAVKLIALLALFIFILVSIRRVRLPEVVRSAAIWLAVLLSLVALYAFREPIESAGREMASVLLPGVAMSDGGSVVVRRAWQGQFVLDGEVNGASVDFVFDTGASLVVLSAADGARAGYDPATLDYRVPVMTAAGMTRVAPVRLDNVSVGDIRMGRVRAAIAQPGDLETSLLGMTFLNRLEGYEVRRDRLVLNP
ncbi:MAG: TIGR02281 family clan AA aspartic protease [Pseudomonadota bacterium]